jgi:hypothetical protein
VVGGTRKGMRHIATWLMAFLICVPPVSGWAWNDETHIAIAIAAGYKKWFNAAGADITKLKAGDVEKKNHYVNSPPGTVVTPQMVLEQVERYNSPSDEKGHLYGAIIASVRGYRTTTQTGKYADYHLALCAHYVGDLSQPLHNTSYNEYNQRYHAATDNVINDEVLDNLSKIEVSIIHIRSENDLAREVARIANISQALGCQVEREGRMLSRQEAYAQISHSASLFRAILEFVRR